VVLQADSANLLAVVSGRVQGVFFRAFVLNICEALGLTGYVRNLDDGTVEVVAEGSRSQLEGLLGKLKQGPRSARVDAVTTVWSGYTGKFSGFSITF
jgi:acylphosphatase